MGIRNWGEPMKEGVAYCDRCGGVGIYAVGVMNDRPVPARPDAGKCWRCNGSGLEPKTKNTKGEINMKFEVTVELQKKVFGQMMVAIVEKGARNKMVSTYDLCDALGWDKKDRASHLELEAVLDTLIKSKHVRYYRNDSRKMYYGITQMAWEQIDAKLNAKKASVEATVSVTEEAPTSDKIPCIVCGKMYTAKGMKRHMATHAEGQTA